MFHIETEIYQATPGAVFEQEPRYVIKEDVPNIEDRVSIYAIDAFLRKVKSTKHVLLRQTIEDENGEYVDSDEMEYLL